MIVHQKAIDGNVKLTDGLVRHYRVPGDMETWHWAMQLNQANAISCALDHYRSHAPRTAGAVVWQLNDCWPVTSWAAIDGDGREKPLFHAIRNAFAPRVVSIQPRRHGLAAVVGNDTDDDVGRANSSSSVAGSTARSAGGRSPPSRCRRGHPDRAGARSRSPRRRMPRASCSWPS